MEEIKRVFKTDKIKIIGLGGSGGNIIDNMYKKNYNHKLTLIDSNNCTHNSCKADEKLLLGPKSTLTLNCMGNVDLGFKACEESREEIIDMIKDVDNIILVGGIGGGCGSAGFIYLNKLAKEMNKNIYTICTRPFKFEGEKRRNVTFNRVLNEIKDYTTISEIDYTNEFMDRTISLLDAFKKLDEIIFNHVKKVIKSITNNKDQKRISKLDVILMDNREK